VYPRRRASADESQMESAHVDEQPRLQVDQSPRPRDRRVLRRRLLEPQAQKAAQRQRVGGAPRDAALRINPLEVADQQQPEDVPGRRLGRPSLAWNGAYCVSTNSSTVGIEHLIEPLVERVPASRRQLIRRDPQSRRPRAVSTSTHGHGQCSTRDRSCRSPIGR
jgi:hypothetical protein